MKTEFELEVSQTIAAGIGMKAKANIIGKAALHKPYVSINVWNRDNTLGQIFIPDDQLERFAVNILKALKSKKLKPTVK